MWKPIHQRPSIFMRNKRKQPRRIVSSVPSIFLPVPMTEELHRHNQEFGNIEIGHCSMQGWRAHMEDQYIIDEFTELEDHLIVSIFDGHSGTFAAEYASANLKFKIEESEAWQEYAKLSVKARKDHSSLLSKALLQAYLQLDESLLSLKRDGLMLDDSGCTAVTCIITPSHIVCANVGDSRAVVGGILETVHLTEDHKPENPEEFQRILDAGGFVLDNRVVGELAMSRAIGDFRYKSNPSLAVHEQLVIPVPDISVHERCLKKDYVLVVACDGVWDVMTNDEAALFVQEYIEKPAAFSIEQIMKQNKHNGSNGFLPAEEEEEDEDEMHFKRRRLTGSKKDNSNNNNCSDDSSNSAEEDDEEDDDDEEGEDSDKAVSASAVNTASALISVALAKGSMDNISAVVVKFPAAKSLSSSQNSD